MIEAGSIGIKAIFIDAEARQSADKFYADLKRKRDEAMSGAGTGAPGASGQVNPGAWRNGGQWGGNSIWVNPGGWRGGGGGGGFPTPGGNGGGGGAGPGGVGGGIPPWLLGWQSPINQQQQIPPWLWGWQSPINPGGQQPQSPPRPPAGPGRAFGFVRPLAAAYLAIRGTEAVMRQQDREADLAYTSRVSGASAALEEEAGNIRSDMSDPIGRRVRGWLARQFQGPSAPGPLRGIFTSDEDRREANDRARNSVKDVQAGAERAAARREANVDAARENQRADLFATRDTTERRLAQSANTYENKRLELDNRLQAIRDQLAIETDPAQAGRLRAKVTSTERSNATILSAAGRARAAEDAEIRRDAVVGSRALQSDVAAAKLEYEDRPRAAAAQRIFGRTREAFEKQTDKEGAQDILRIGRFELMSMQKEATRRGVAESFDPRGAAFGVKESGKEDIGTLNKTIGELIKTIGTWMPGLK